MVATISRSSRSTLVPPKLRRTHHRTMSLWATTPGRTAEEIGAALERSEIVRRSTVCRGLAILAGLIGLAACAAPSGTETDAMLPPNIEKAGAARPGEYQVFNGPGKNAYAFSNDVTYCDNAFSSMHDRTQCMLSRGNVAIDPNNTFYFPYSSLPADQPPATIEPASLPAATLPFSSAPADQSPKIPYSVWKNDPDWPPPEQ